MVNNVKALHNETELLLAGKMALVRRKKQPLTSFPCLLLPCLSILLVLDSVSQFRCYHPGIICYRKFFYMSVLWSLELKKI